MTVNDIKATLKCKVFAGEELLDREVHTACGSDMMSDVLAYVKDQSILLTGLVNAQVVRTADMMDMLCVVLVRGKQPTEEMITLAEERGHYADVHAGAYVYRLRHALGKMSAGR